MFKHAVAAALAILALLPAPSMAQAITTALEKRGDQITYSVTNQSREVAVVNEANFVNFAKSGHGIFLYDPVTKQVQTGWGTVLQSPRMRAAKPNVVVLSPGATYEQRYPLQHLTRLFLKVPRCFYLVAVYRHQEKPSAKANAVSNAIHICLDNAVSGSRAERSE